MSLAYPQFRSSRCTRYRYRYSECSRCADACPHEAITLSDEGAALDSTRCQNCALCVSACRTGAWESEAFKPIELLRQAIKQETFSFACAPSGLSADAVVPCLGAIDAATLAYLAKRRIAVSLHGTANCADCAHNPRGAAQLALDLDACAVLSVAAEPAERGPWLAPVLADDPTATPPGGKGGFAPSRRQLFRRLLGRGMDEIASAAAPVEVAPPVPDKAIRAGACALPEQRELLQIVCARSDERPFEVPVHEGLPLMALALHPGCTVCEACFRACPTGAIQIEESPADWQLRFDADRCVACEVCLEVCQPRVLDAEPVFDARPEQPARVLHALAKQRCARCDRHFVSAEPEETCPICRDDEDAFAAIFG
ncbi:4Fe-4S dicluster domain-containing protein [Aromatoleum petrolei]|uniref:4Fe-4S dicluster domain-containing protein n=1 Tax=Aromatoleum petrolei TaxID=76116 RepID=A0ABX1MM95_9RHOO|nr:4Fe-4S dicluster domain-containing protein [Aromatoleum petrolei]NMF89074.1 4Fe-4S dicluster domain-containing protein [Aromatoleum petrolei]QTQ38334.1 [4Fe-4S] iron-sulfur domain-containing protein [Aromatoleum petrolei]